MLPPFTQRLRRFKPWALSSSTMPRRMYCAFPSFPSRFTSRSVLMMSVNPEINRTSNKIVRICDPVVRFRRYASTSSSLGGMGSENIDILPDASTSLNLLELMELHTTTAASTGTIFSDTAPVIFTADLLCALKDLDGLSWVQVILFTTIVMRLLTGLPIAIAQQRSLKRLADVKPQVVQLAEDLKRETGLAVRKFGWDEKTAKIMFRKSYKKHWRKLMEEHNCHPMKSICLALLQIPVWICFSSALRNIVFGLPLPRIEGLFRRLQDVPGPSFVTINRGSRKIPNIIIQDEQAQRWYEMFQEGTPWIENLTVSDPYVLPAIFLTTNLLNIYLHSRNRAVVPVRSNLQIALPWVLSGGIVFISVLACYVPSAVTLYWATSSSVALTQNIVLMHPGIRKRLKLPDYSSTVPQQKEKVSAKV